jgi:hypothetical protein
VNAKSSSQYSDLTLLLPSSSSSLPNIHSVDRHLPAAAAAAAEVAAAAAAQIL